MKRGQAWPGPVQFKGKKMSEEKKTTKKTSKKKTVKKADPKKSEPKKYKAAKRLLYKGQKIEAGEEVNPSKEDLDFLLSKGLIK